MQSIMASIRFRAQMMREMPGNLILLMLLLPISVGITGLTLLMLWAFSSQMHFGMLQFVIMGVAMVELFVLAIYLGSCKIGWKKSFLSFTISLVVVTIFGWFFTFLW